MKTGRRKLELMEILESGVKTTAEVLDIAMSGYGESYRKMRKKIAGVPETSEKEKEEIRKEKQAIHSALGRLKKENFVKQENSGWNLTNLGDKNKRFLRARLGKNIYEAEDGEELVVITFDVPEQERWKRDWLRSALNNMGFNLLQGSVWIGKKKITDNFLDDLKVLNIAPYVEIFSVDKMGSLKRKKI